MAAAVSYYRVADAACAKRSSIYPPSSCATRVRINPACVARPEDAAARNAKRRCQRGEEWPRSPDVKRRRLDDVSSPDALRKKREIVTHPRDEQSQESMRRRRDDARRRMFPHGRSKRKRENVDDDARSRRGSSTSSRSSFGRPRPETSLEDHMVAHREDARRIAMVKGREREQDTTRIRSRSGTRGRLEDPCAAQKQQRTVAAVAKHRVFSLDGRPLQEEYEESFEEAKLRRMETQQKREEARRELAKVVQTVFFNDPYISYLDVFKR